MRSGCSTSPPWGRWLTSILRRAGGQLHAARRGRRVTGDCSSALSRREFLRLTSLSAAGLVFPVRWLEPEKVLGRVVQAQADIYQGASYTSSRIGNLIQDQVVPIDAAIVGDDIPPYNRVWYWSRELGYLHSSLIQPVRNDLNRPLTSVPYRGLLMEVSVPYADAHFGAECRRGYRLSFLLSVNRMGQRGQPRPPPSRLVSHPGRQVRAGVLHPGGAAAPNPTGRGRAALAPCGAGR